MKKAIIASLAFAAAMGTAFAGEILTQPTYKLTCEYQVPDIAPSTAWNTPTRSGVGIADKFYVVDYNEGVKVYVRDGEAAKLIKTIPVTEGYYLWTSSNLDDAGHLLVQVDKHAFNGQNSANGDHGFMVIDTKTDEVIVPFLPMTCGGVYRYDVMAHVSGNILESEKVGIYSVLQNVTTTYRFLYNNVGAEKPSYWVTKALTTAMGIDPATKVNDVAVPSLFPAEPAALQKQASTGYALQYKLLDDENFTIAVYANPYYTETYSAEGKFGNGIRRFGANYVPADKWFYTPQHSGLTGFNFFTLDGKDYIIYPAGSQAEAPDGFAIAEVSYVDSPKTDMTMEGETLVDGKLAGPIKARVYATLAENGAPKYKAITSGAPSYSVEPVEGDPKSVYIYFFATGAPGMKYKFTVGAEDEPVVPELGDPTAPATVYPTADITTADGVTEGVYTLIAAKAEGATAPAINAYNEVNTLRLYADNTLTIKGGVMTDIKFVLNTATNGKRYTTVTCNTGEITPEQTADDTEFSWKGKADEVVFTVGHDATLGSDGNTKRGQVHILQIDINGGVKPAPEPTLGEVGAAAVQDGFELKAIYSLDNIAPLQTQLNHRSGVGYNDKFYVNEHATGIKVYNNVGELIKTIPASEGYHNWVSCNIDDAGHIFAQIDKKAFDGQCSANGDHGFMLIDSKTDEVINPFLPMTCGDVYRYDAMAHVNGNILESEKVGIYSVLQNATTSYRFLYNNIGAEKPSYWTTKAFTTAMGIDPTTKVNDVEVPSLFPAEPAGLQKQASTGYAMQYKLSDDENFTIAVYANPYYSQTYSAEGKFGNGIRRFGANYVAADKWFYTPQHSGLTGFNFFTIAGKDYIIYPAGVSNAAGDAFAIAEVSYVDSPKTDMTMEGETLVDGKPVGALKARVFAFEGENGSPKFGANPSCPPSYTIEPVEDDPNSVYIYVFNSGAPASKWIFTVGDQVGVDAIETVDPEAPAVYYNLQGVRVANPTKGLYIKAQGGKATKVIL